MFCIVCKRNKQLKQQMKGKNRYLLWYHGTSRQTYCCLAIYVFNVSSSWKGKHQLPSIVSTPPKISTTQISQPNGHFYFSFRKRHSSIPLLRFFFHSQICGLNRDTYKMIMDQKDDLLFGNGKLQSCKRFVGSLGAFANFLEASLVCGSTSLR